MIRANHSITFLAGEYIARLFVKSLPKELVFHNFHHTFNVVRGIKDISKHLSLEKSKLEICILAAWFHDSGHVIKYKGHELESQIIAENWLDHENYPKDKLDQVLACIAATRMPQKPTNLLEEIICDADLYHLSLSEYCHIQFQLREERKRIFQKTYTDLEWMKENLSFLHRHQYFTSYGKRVLEERKKKNILKCEQLVSEYSK